jgi:hypothetical protein
MPKGYTRSDERIREDVCDRLSEADVECEDVTVVVQSGVVTLSGHAPSGDTRREIERIAEGVSGVKDVTNQIHTGRQRDEDGGESRKSTSTSSSSYMGSSSGKRDSSKTS